MTAEEAFLLINNLDYEAEYRNCAPQWSSVVVNHNGIVVGVMRHQEQLTLELGKQHLMMYPGTVQFAAWPGRFATLGDLISEISRCKGTAGEY